MKPDEIAMALDISKRVPLVHGAQRFLRVRREDVLSFWLAVHTRFMLVSQKNIWLRCATQVGAPEQHTASIMKVWVVSRRWTSLQSSHEPLGSSSNEPDRKRNPLGGLLADFALMRGTKSAALQSTARKLCRSLRAAGCGPP